MGIIEVLDRILGGTKLIKSVAEAAKKAECVPRWLSRLLQNKDMKKRTKVL